MKEMTKKSETVTTRPVSYLAKRIVGALFILIEVILGARLVLKLLGANPANIFVKAIYNITQFFVGLFEGIFAKVSDNAKSVFEPATLIAIVVVAVVAWVVLRLMTPRQQSSTTKTEYTTESPQPHYHTEKVEPVDQSEPTDSSDSH